MEKSQNVGTKIAFTPLKYGILGQIFFNFATTETKSNKRKINF